MESVFDNGGLIGTRAFYAKSIPNTTISPYFVTGIGCDLSTGTSFAYPSDIQLNDFIIVAQCNDSGDVTSPPTDSASTSYSTLTTIGGDSPDASVWYKFADGTESGTNITINRSGGRGSAVLAIYRGVNTISPFDTTFTSAANTSGAPDPPSITTVSTYTLIVAIGLLDDDEVSATAPSGYSNILFQDDNQGSDASCTTMIADKSKATTGAENPGTFGISSGGDAWVALTIALQKTDRIYNTTSGIWDIGRSSGEK